MADRFPLILNTSANQIQEIASGDTLDLTGSNIKGVGIITAANISGNIIAGAGSSNIVAGIITATQLDLNGDIDVDGHTNLDNLSIAGVSTFTGAIDANGDLDVDGHTNLDNLSVAGVSTFSGDVTISVGTGGIFTLQGSGPSIELVDANANDDFRIHVNHGIFQIEDATNANADRFKIDSSGVVTIPGNTDFGAGIDVTGNATVSGNLSVGGVLTYEDVTNVDSVGIVTAREGVFLPDLKQLKIGNTAAAPDLYLWHNSSTGNSNISNKTGDLFIQGNNGSGTVVNQIAVKSNAAVELNYQASKKFETTSTGIKVTNPSNNPDIKITGALGSGAEHRIFVAGTNSESLQITGNTRLFFNANDHHFRDASTTQDLFVITSNGDVNLPRDSKKIQIGAGQDLELFHNGSNTFIRNNTGYLVFSSENGSTYYDADNHYFRKADSSEFMGKFLQDGAVELYHNNLKRFETSADGCIFSGPTNTTASVQIKGTEGRSAEIRLIADEGDDFTDTVRLHQSINGNFYLQNLTASATFENMLVAAPNGSVDLYYDNGKRFETTTHGVTVTGSSNNPTTDSWETNSSIITSGSYGGGIAMVDGPRGFVQYLHGAGVNWELKNAATDSTPETNIKAIANGAVELYYDNTKRFETTNTGSTISGDLNFSGAPAKAISLPDNKRIYFGDGDDFYIGSNGSNGEFVGQVFVYNHMNLYDNVRLRLGNSQDLDIYHDTNHSYIIDNGTGDLKLRGSESIKLEDTSSGKPMITCTKNFGTEIYHQMGSAVATAEKKLETTTTGSKTTGYHQQTAPIGFCAYRRDTGTDDEYPLKNSSNNAVNSTYFGHSSIQTPRGQLTTNTQYDNNGSGGSCYSHNGTKFTAPIAGVYTLTFNLSLYVASDNGGDNSVGWGFFKNQSKVNWGTYDSGLSVTQSTPYIIGQDSTTNLSPAFEIGAPHLTIITTLAAGDEIQVGWDNMSKILGVRSFIFSGYLLG